MQGRLVNMPALDDALLSELPERLKRYPGSRLTAFLQSMDRSDGPVKPYRLVLHPADMLRLGQWVFRSTGDWRQNTLFDEGPSTDEDLQPGRVLIRYAGDGPAPTPGHSV